MAASVKPPELLARAVSMLTTGVPRSRAVLISSLEARYVDLLETANPFAEYDEAREKLDAVARDHARRGAQWILAACRLNPLIGVDRVYAWYLHDPSLDPFAYPRGFIHDLRTNDWIERDDIPPLLVSYPWGPERSGDDLRLERDLLMAHAPPPWLYTWEPKPTDGPIGEALRGEGSIDDWMRPFVDYRVAPAVEADFRKIDAMINNPAEHTFAMLAKNPFLLPRQVLEVAEKSGVWASPPLLRRILKDRRLRRRVLAQAALIGGPPVAIRFPDLVKEVIDLLILSGENEAAARWAAQTKRGVEEYWPVLGPWIGIASYAGDDPLIWSMLIRKELAGDEPIGPSHLRGPDLWIGLYALEGVRRGKLKEADVVKWLNTEPDVPRATREAILGMLGR